MTPENLGIPYISPREEKHLRIVDNELGKPSNDNVYNIITERIIEQIETSGHMPWQRLHDGSKGIKKQYIPFAEMPLNYASLKTYRGINALLLMQYPQAKEIQVTKDGKPATITVKDWKPISDGRLFWLTFKQVKEAGGTLKKGSKSAIAVYYNWIFKYKGKTIPEEKYKELVAKFGCSGRNRSEDCADLDKVAFLKYYNVFNESDVEGVDFEVKRKELAKRNKAFLNDDQKILAAELVLKHMPKPPELIITHLSDSESPHYVPYLDRIVMPLKEQARSLEAWYGVNFHEHIHATGAPIRTDRRNKPGFERGARSGDAQYALEELVAEIGSVFLNAESGIMLNSLKNNAVYIKGWAKKVKEGLKKDNKAIFKAAAEAQKAADYILNRDKNGEPAFWKEYKKEVQEIPPGKEKTKRKTGTKELVKPDLKHAARFLKTADSLTRLAEKKYEELEHARTNTPKRMREYNSKKIDADIAFDKAALYRAVGAAIEKGTLPGILKDISPVKNKDHFYLFVRGLKQGGYYEVFRENEARFKTLSQAQLTNLGKEIGLKSIKEVEKAYNELMKLSGQNKRTKEELEAEEIKRLIDKVRFKKIPGFFPTPDKLAERLVYQADIQEKDTVLEPSAGIGSIADAVKKLHPKAKLSVIELMGAFREILSKKGYKLAGSDFLEHTKKYDKIIMNPPFEKLQDTEHVRHAFSLLKNGGRVVSIMSPGGFHNSQKKAREFREWFEQVGGVMEELPKGSFKSAFSPTGVNTVMVIIDKLAESEPQPKDEDLKLLELEAEAIIILQMQNKNKGIGGIESYTLF